MGCVCVWGREVERRRGGQILELLFKFAIQLVGIHIIQMNVV